MHSSKPFTIAIVGSGPAGLAAAEVLAEAGCRVTVYDRMPTPARKFLLAGLGGLNLTHSENLDKLLSRYRPGPELLSEAIRNYPPDALMQWSAGLGQKTFVGSSGKIFPAAFKATPLLRAWLARLENREVRFAFRHRWKGWTGEGQLLFETPEGDATSRPDAILLALGGASWPKLGTDGSWAEILREKSIVVSPLKPANVGFLASWSEHFRSRFEGEPLKRIAASFSGQTVRGEAVITRGGIEGGALYAIGRQVRDAILENGRAVIGIDFRPDITEEVLSMRLNRDRKKQSLSNFLRKAAGLPPVAVALLRETAGDNLPNDHFRLAMAIKNVQLTLTGVGPIERAISTAGGIHFSEVDETFMLRRLPGVFAAGEMLDWEAPTGGYLLQGCFSTGIAAARGILSWLEKEH